MQDDIAPRRLAFLEHPEALTNPVQAALDVGYSKSTAEGKSHIWRKKYLPILLEKMRARLDGLGITDERLQNEMATLAFYNIGQCYKQITYVDDDGKERQRTVLKDILELPEVLQKCIKEIEHDAFVAPDGSVHSYVIKVKFIDKLPALIKLMEMRGMFTKHQLPPPERNPLDELTPEELEEIAKIHEAASTRLLKRSGEARDAEAITVKPVALPSQRKRKGDYDDEA